jgi:hypothetical protein
MNSLPSSHFYNYPCKDFKLSRACVAEADNMKPMVGQIHHYKRQYQGTSPMYWRRKVTKIINARSSTCQKEQKHLIVTGKSFSIENPQGEEVCNPVLETNKIKHRSDRYLDKLKVRIVVHGDIQDKSNLEDKWSPTASFHGLKMCLAHACHLKVRVCQLDFIDIYL